MNEYTSLDVQGHEQSRNAKIHELFSCMCACGKGGGGGGSGTNIYPFLASLDFCELLITFANSLVPDQDRHILFRC